MKNLFLIPLVIVAMAVGGCEAVQNSGTKQTVGGATGAVLGGLAGSQLGSGSGRLWATGAGVLVGTLLGSEVGRSLDKADMAYAQRANQRAYEAPVGETISWNNPDSGNYGTVTPIRDGYSSNSRYCREYEQEIYVDGRRETGTGTACQNSDGSWEIVR